jgi:DNA invertase Pin-like site-specific DNA recombinase
MDINQNTERAQNPLTAAIYTRTATASQSSDDLQAQIETCKAEAARHGWAINDDLIFSDGGVGGLTTARKGLQRMVNTVHSQPGICDVLVVADGARIGRDLSSVAVVFATLAYHNVLVHSVAAGGTVTSFGVLQCERCRGVQEG